MNSDNYLILIKGEIKTTEIKTCRYNEVTKKYDVQFNSGKTYSYLYQNVVIMKNPKVVNASSVRIIHNGRELFNIQSIRVFADGHQTYLHICFEDGSKRDYKRQELLITQSCLVSVHANDVFTYMKNVARISTVRNPDTGELILSKRYEKMEFVSPDVALAVYLGAKNMAVKHKQDYVPIFPFGCNNSQYRAVTTAMLNQISVIQGPPGTGKTQTILNMIANILIQGKTVLVVSNNNAAIDNIREKLSDSRYHLDFVVAPLGNQENKRAFLERQTPSYPEFLNWYAKDTKLLWNRVKQKSGEVKEFFDKQEQLALLRQELDTLRMELQHFKQYLHETKVNIFEINHKKKVKSDDLMECWQICQHCADTKGKIGFWLKVKLAFKYGLNWRIYRRDLSAMVTSFQKAYYDCKEAELQHSYEQIENWIAKANQKLPESLGTDSMALLRDALAKQYSVRGFRRQFTDEDFWKNSYEVLREYPVVLSTTFSSRSSLNDEVIYDYVIMDEASQVDVATGALALSCARNAIIVGDTKQLPNVLTKEEAQEAKAIFESYRIAQGYQFTNSFLQSVIEVLPEVPQTLLREHYRCHPKIINFCNQKFYHGQLIIMTEDHGETDALRVVETVKGNHARGHYSQRQIDVIREEIIPNYVTNPEKVGIIAPYKAQVEAMKKEFPNMDVATVHKFQGREKDMIIISTVDDEITDFTDDPYLLNVAVSRAKRNLTLVVTGNELNAERNISDLLEYIKYNNLEVVESKVYSVFDYLYKQYTKARFEFLKDCKRISEFESENLMYGLISEVLKMAEFSALEVVCHFPVNMLIRDPYLLDDEDCKYAMNPATHVDFLICNRISKRPIMAVEVDGYAFHKEGSVQAKRDERKDRILKLYRIPLERFATNSSGEQKRLVECLKRNQ